jgi:FtsH-binding integral membrane protein
MATVFPESPPTRGAKDHSIVDDFMYGSNVAGSHLLVRMGFLRKVYGILSAQLLFTTLVSVLFIACEPLKLFMRGNPALLAIPAFGSIGLIIALAFKSRETPLNYILLALFTLCESILVGVTVTMYDVSVVIEAFALTAAVTLSLTFYTLQSKRDFSSWGAGLFSVLWVLIIAGFMQLFLQSEMLDMAMAVGGAVLFSLFIIFDTHMIMHRVSPEEYIHASVSLYLDIINLFLHILRILGEARRN